MSNLRSQNRFFSALGLLIIILSFAGLLLFLSVWSYEGTFWHSWFPLLIPESEMNDLREDSLLEISGGQLISESNSIVKYNSYRTFKEITVRDLQQGDSLYYSDPRYDPYMKDIPKYFNQGIYKIFYLPNIQSPLKYIWFFSHSELWTGTSLILPDADFSFFELFLFCMALFLLCWSSPRFIIPGFAVLFLGIHCVLAGQNQILLVLAVTALYLRLMMARDSRSLFFWIFSIIPVGLAVFGNIMDFQQSKSVFFLFSLTLGSNLFWENHTMRNVQKGLGKMQHDHFLFEPVPLYEKRVVKERLKRSPLLLTAALVTMILAVFNWPGENLLPVDVPEAQSSGGIWAASELNPRKMMSLLPDSEDFLRHKAFQESFMYGGSYTLPQPGSGITLDEFVMKDGQVRESRKTVLEFSPSWFEAGLAEMTESGPSRLLRTELVPPVVSLRSSVISGIHPLLLLAFAVLIF
jgi:hypothetical protein